MLCYEIAGCMAENASFSDLKAFVKAVDTQ